MKRVNDEQYENILKSRVAGATPETGATVASDTPVAGDPATQNSPSGQETPVSDKEKYFAEFQAEANAKLELATLQADLEEALTDALDPRIAKAAIAGLGTLGRD